MYVRTRADHQLEPLAKAAGKPNPPSDAMRFTGAVLQLVPDPVA